MSENKPFRFLLLGASRGLGWQTYLELRAKYAKAHFQLVSRKIENRSADLKNHNHTQLISCDFSKTVEVENQFEKFHLFNPTHIIYFAGGGPYGFFSDKKWSDHQWSLQVTFLTPALLLHHILQNQQSQFAQLQKMIFIGSAIAETQPDIKASSYCAAKHALKGLISTVKLELAQQNNQSIEIDLFSPGYFKSDLLPAHSAPRENGLAQDVEKIALELIEKIN